MTTAPPEVFMEAFRHHQSGKLEEAERLYHRVLETDPQHADSLHLLGAIAHQKRNFTTAEELIRRAIAINARSPAFYNNLGHALKEMGRAREAEENYRKALTLKPDYLEALNSLGMLYQAQELLDDASIQYRTALSLDPKFFKALNNLGGVLQAQGKKDEAAECFLQALVLQPKLAEARSNLGKIRQQQGRFEEAKEQFQHYLELDPADARGVRLLLASMGEGALPEKAPDAQMQRLYAERANTWDQKTATNRPYRGHRLVAEALKKSCPRPENLDILDAGCGTGLAGALLQGMARRLDGVDISQPMLDKAAEKKCYTRLHAGDLVSFMTAAAQSYDAIVSAATLIHFGDLAPVFRAAATTLRPGGVFIFTLFPDETEDGKDGVRAATLPGLAQGGCYMHGKIYVRKQAERAGFSVESLETDIHEYDGESPVPCLVVILKKK